MSPSLMPRVASIFAALAVAAAAAAADQPVPEGERKSRGDRAADVMLDRPHAYLSNQVEEFSRKLDGFFGDPNRVYDSTKSTVQLRGHITYSEGGDTLGGPEIRAHLSLPNTEDRLKLVIQRGVTAATQTAAERDIKEATGSDRVAAPGAQQDNSYYLGLKALAAEALGTKFSAEAGVKARWPLDPYVRLRASGEFIVSNWAIRLSETPLWKNSEGYTTATELNFDRPLSEEWLFRFTSKATWRFKPGLFDLAQIGGLYYTPDKRTAYSLELGAFGQSEPSTSPTVYAITLRARRQIHNDWLYVELAPQAIYQQLTGFRPAYSVMLRIEALFGDRYLQP